MRFRVVLAICALSLTNLTPASSQSLAADGTMKLLTTITGDISPKSVRASGTGYVSAHNMMYRHSVTIYNAETMKLLKTIPDKVDLASFGFAKKPGSYRGAPVEGAYSPDGKYLYVTNYAMYGAGFNKEGTDICKPADGYDRSFLYRIKTDTWEIDAIYRVGTVPKVVQVSPDNKYVLVSNWCSYDLSIISIAEDKLIKTIPIGRYPRGIAISSDSRYAYVAEMGGTHIHRIALGTWEKKALPIGSNPRALVLSKDDQTLYATLNSSGKVVEFDLQTNKVTKSAATGKAARSLDISSDGSSLYVVNFFSDTVAKVRTSDFKVLQRIRVCNEPIGITYEPIHTRVWVACYGGSIKVFSDLP